jgi:hypothetical protein
MKPQGETLECIVDQQFKTGRCRSQLFAQKGYSDAEVIKIFATLTSVCDVGNSRRRIRA